MDTAKSGEPGRQEKQKGAAVQTLEPVFTELLPVLVRLLTDWTRPTHNPHYQSPSFKQ